MTRMAQFPTWGEAFENKSDDRRRPARTAFGEMP